MLKYLAPLMSLIIVVSTQACSRAKAPSPEEPCNFQQNSYKQRVSWHKLPVRLKAHTSLSEPQVQALREAIEVWNTIRAKEWGTTQNFFELSHETHTGVGYVADNQSVVSLSTDWSENAREQAETVLMWEGNRIVEADIRLNGNKPLSTADPLGENDIDLVALYVHELGHVLGLLHIDVAEYTVMSFELERGTDKRRTPGNLELDALRCEY
ncbi:MAG: hypothetical protein IT287_02995 [Bdellovibrionaceae bacterium]|nr:hypothetical protein [Pseudobdellovibrionaceae bacterium]